MTGHHSAKPAAWQEHSFWLYMAVRGRASQTPAVVEFSIGLMVTEYHRQNRETCCAWNYTVSMTTLDVQSKLVSLRAGHRREHAVECDGVHHIVATATGIQRLCSLTVDGAFCAGVSIGWTAGWRHRCAMSYSAYLVKRLLL